MISVPKKKKRKKLRSSATNESNAPPELRVTYQKEFDVDFKAEVLIMVLPRAAAVTSDSGIREND